MDQEPFKIPPSLLAQINECSNGGYVLFTFNSAGQPVVHSNFDTPMNAMALEYYINHYIKTLEVVNLETSVEFFSDDFEIQEEPEEPDWPDEDDEEEIE
jgi:hypothetical protein